MILAHMTAIILRLLNLYGRTVAILNNNNDVSVCSLWPV